MKLCIYNRSCTGRSGRCDFPECNRKTGRAVNSSALVIVPNIRLLLRLRRREPSLVDTDTLNTQTARELFGSRFRRHSSRFAASGRCRLLPLDSNTSTRMVTNMHQAAEVVRMTLLSRRCCLAGAMAAIKLLTRVSAAMELAASSDKRRDCRQNRRTESYNSRRLPNVSALLTGSIAKSTSCSSSSIRDVPDGAEDAIERWLGVEGH